MQSLARVLCWATKEVTVAATVMVQAIIPDRDRKGAGNAAVGRSSGAVAMPLQLPQTPSGSEVRARSQNAGDAGRPNQKATDVPRCLHVRPELFVLGQDHLYSDLPREFIQAGRLGSFHGGLTTLDCGSTEGHGLRLRFCETSPFRVDTNVTGIFNSSSILKYAFLLRVHSRLATGSPLVASARSFNLGIRAILS